MTGRAYGLILISLTAAGCKVGPDYRPPTMAAPPNWSGLKSDMTNSPRVGPTTRPTTQPADVAMWWRNLDDPTLDSLISRAIATNLNLKVATARIREARAQRQSAAAGLWPQIGLSGSYRYSGTSLNTGPEASGGTSLLKDARNTAISSAVQSLAADQSINAEQLASGTLSQVLTKAINNRFTDSNQTSHRGQNLFQAGFDATWELDVFGGVSRAVEAAEADIMASVEDRRATMVSLASEVALDYVQMRGYQQRLAIALQNIESQRGTVELTEQRLSAEFASRLEVAQAKTQLAATTSQVPVLQDAIRQTIYQLSTLLGLTPEALVAELETTAALPVNPPAIPLGLPSDLLRRRPDIRSAERQLAAATARIGEATADLFPKFSLSGSFGAQSRDINHVLDHNSLIWGIGPAVSWPIFQGGRVRANIEIQNARQEQALAAYELTVLSAFKEVEAALSAYLHEQTRHQSLAAAVQTSQEAAELSTRLYSGGMGAFLNVLEAQRTLYSSQDALIQSDIAVITDLIALYKALGGGWEG